MKPNRRHIVIGAGVLALAAGGAGATVAIGGSEDGGAASGPGADRAKAKALELYPGSKANAVERDGENGATWEVELTKPDGPTVDVRLDARFGHVVTEGDREDENGE